MLSEGAGGGEPLLLGLDIGTSTMKAVLVDPIGGERAAAGVPTPFVSGDGGTEMDVGSLFAALHRLLTAVGPERARVAAVGVAGMGEVGAPLGAAGSADGVAALAPVIAWHDPRGAETIARLERTFGPELGRRIGQQPRTVSSVAKLGWLVEHGVGTPRRWLGVPELCLRRLTGVEATEHSFACRTGCYDVGERAWMPEVAEAAGFSSAVFAPVRRAGDAIGSVTAEAATWAGLPAGIPVTLAGHDHLAGAAGASARVGDVVDSVGTAESVLRYLEAMPDPSGAIRLRGAISVRPGAVGWSVMTGAARAGVVLGRVAAVLGRTPEELDRLAEDARPVEMDALVPRIQSSEAVDLPGAPPGDIWRGLLEALARRTLEAASRLEALAGPASRMLAFGGGSRSRPGMRAKAERSPVPVIVPRVREAAGRGAALFAGVAAGWWPSVQAAPAPLLDEVAV